MTGKITKRELKKIKLVHDGYNEILKGDISNKYKNQLLVLKGAINSLLGYDALISLEEKGYFVYDEKVFTIVYSIVKDELLLWVISDKYSVDFTDRFDKVFN